ncbi:MAG: GGDEF domain-containing protein [Pseudomonadota bacterium]
MLTKKILGQLAASRLFRQVDIGLLGELFDGCPRHQLMPGDTLIEAGAQHHTLFVILSGQLRVYAGGHDLPANAILNPGDCAGEMTLIDGERSSALVLAATPSELLAIPHERMWEMIEFDPLIARNLLAIMAGRLRDNNLTLVTTQSRTLEFEQASSVDTLTGLHNRRWIDDAFMRMIRRCRNDGAPVSLLLADVDWLGRINERNGFLTGDNALKRAARSLAESLRPQDMIGRHGGDEFAVLLPQTKLPVARGIAARLCGIVIEADIRTPPSHEPLSISCGVVAVRADETLEAALARAEQALRQAKENGRNRVETLD